MEHDAPYTIRGGGMGFQAFLKILVKKAGSSVAKGLRTFG